MFGVIYQAVVMRASVQHFYGVGMHITTFFDCNCIAVVVHLSGAHVDGVVGVIDNWPVNYDS